jgi:hypothetical protein
MNKRDVDIDLFEFFHNVFLADTGNKLTYIGLGYYSPIRFKKLNDAFLTIEPVNTSLLHETFWDIVARMKK